MNSNSARQPLRILIVDDHAIVRAGLRNLINDESDMRVEGEAANCGEALQAAQRDVLDMVVLDLRLPDGSGVEIIDSLKRMVPRVRVLVLTSFADDTLLLAALKAGADGYLLKDVAEADLIGAIREIARAGAVTPSPLRPVPVTRELGSNASTASCLDRLTGQERRVFDLVGRGHSNREVANAAGLTEKTVRNYLSRVFDKLRIRRRSELVALYISSQPWHR